MGALRGPLGSPIYFTYDNAGNILSKTEYAYTTASDLSSLTPLDTIAYTYGDSEWKDLLTAYDGQAITYDEIGNPLNYRGRQMYWSGRDLTAVVASGGAVQFNYNAAGQRISKTYGPNTTKFYYDDSGNLIGMRKGYEQPIKFQVNYATGEIDGFVQGTETYWFRKNQQGDVTGIFNTSYGGTELFVEYEYDAWGNVISITGVGADTIGQINPIRYRGYFYDTETGYYYLNSRYYDPTVGRLLNADIYASTGQGVLGCNMFTYRLNNPVNMVDPSGEYSVDLEQYRRMAEQYGKAAADGWARDAMATMNAAEGQYALERASSSKDTIILYEEIDTTTEFYKKPLNIFANGQCTWYCRGRALELTGVVMPNGNGGQWYDNASAYQKGSEIRSRSVAVFEGTTPDTYCGHVVFVEFWDKANNIVYYTEANWNMSEQYNGWKKCSLEKFRDKCSNMVLVGFIYTNWGE